MTEHDFDVWLDVVVREGREYGEASLERYIDEFGEPPLDREDMGGWDEDAWADAWKEIDGEHELGRVCRMPREILYEQDIPAEYLELCTAAQTEFYNALLSLED